MMTCVFSNHDGHLHFDVARSVGVFRVIMVGVSMTTSVTRSVGVSRVTRARVGVSISDHWVSSAGGQLPRCLRPFSRHLQ